MKSLIEKGVPEQEAKSQLRRLILKALVHYNKGGEMKNMVEETVNKPEAIVKEAKDAVVGDALRELKEVVEKLAAKLEDVGKRISQAKPSAEVKPSEDKKPDEEKKPEALKPAAPAASAPMPPPTLPKPVPSAAPSGVGGVTGPPRPIAPPKKEEEASVCPKC